MGCEVKKPAAEHFGRQKISDVKLFRAAKQVGYPAI